MNETVSFGAFITKTSNNSSCIPISSRCVFVVIVFGSITFLTLRAGSITVEGVRARRAHFKTETQYYKWDSYIGLLLRENKQLTRCESSFDAYYSIGNCYSLSQMYMFDENTFQTVFALGQVSVISVDHRLGE